MTPPFDQPEIPLRLQFAKNLRVIRTQRGLSQEKLGELAGLHRTYVSQAERGLGNVTIDNLEKIAQALAVDATKLLSVTKDQ